MSDPLNPAAAILAAAVPVASPPAAIVSVETVAAKVKADAKAAFADVVKAVGHRAAYMGLGAALALLATHLL